MTQEMALKILKTGANVFLTGEPGSGKTHTINRYVGYLRSHGIDPAITASTGIAATHIGGVTIHSWSGIGIKKRLSKGDLRGITGNDVLKKRVKKANVLIIDEISMLPPETLQMVDTVCRTAKESSQPFGGVQVVLVGDFFQLPPVVKRTDPSDDQVSMFEESSARFAYESPVWQEAEFVSCYLDEQYRQDDGELLEILSKIRANLFDEDSLQVLGQRKTKTLELPPDVPKLYSHNIDVDSENDKMLAKIPGEAEFFPMKTKGNAKLVNAMKKGCLSPEHLYLKKGAAVMFTKNNNKAGYVNGTLGTLERFAVETGMPVVKLRSGREVEVAYADWLVEENGEIKGCLSQIPLRLAWAITVHKSQGISLDEAVIDLSRVFEYGQGYVALSRVRSLSGIHLLGWNSVAFQVDSQVLEKDREFRRDSAQAEKIFGRMADNKLRIMYDEFITLYDGEIQAVDIVPKIKKQQESTYDETLTLWNAGKSSDEIAKLRNLTEVTILGHLEKLAGENRIKRSDLKRVVPQDLLPDLPMIQAAFKKLNTDKLSPAFAYFDGKYSYESLRIARMTIE